MRLESSHSVSPRAQPSFLVIQVFPKQLMLEKLPVEVDILCTHPMFGPTSGAGSWKGLNFQYEKVRVLDDPARQLRVEKFLGVRCLPT